MTSSLSPSTAQQPIDAATPPTDATTMLDRSVPAERVVDAPAATVASLNRVPALAPAIAPPTAPKIAKYVAPNYPNAAFSRGLEGWVQVRLQITPQGDVTDVKVEDGEKRQLFARAALAAVKQWKYEPLPDATSATPLSVRLEFRLDR